MGTPTFTPHQSLETRRTSSSHLPLTPLESFPPWQMGISFFRTVHQNSCVFKPMWFPLKRQAESSASLQLVAWRERFPTLKNQKFESSEVRIPKSCQTQPDERMPSHHLTWKCTKPLSKRKIVCRVKSALPKASSISRWEGKQQVASSATRTCHIALGLQPRTFQDPHVLQVASDVQRTPSQAEGRGANVGKTWLGSLY